MALDATRWLTSPHGSQLRWEHDLRVGYLRTCLHFSQFYSNVIFPKFSGTTLDIYERHNGAKILWLSKNASVLTSALPNGDVRFQGWFSKPASIYLFKVNNGNTRTIRENCSKLTIKSPERRHWHWIRFHTFFWCFCFGLVEFHACSPKRIFKVLSS